MKLLVFPEHRELDNRHAMFAPSSPAWLNYDDRMVAERVITNSRKELGTELHSFSSSSIRRLDTLTKNKYDIIRCFKSYLKGKYDRSDDPSISQEERDKKYNRLVYLYKALDYLPDEVWPTVNMYINDAVNYRMTPECHLFYSWNFFGTADAISFDVDDKILRIHDLKTGSKAVNLTQLYVYAAYFCLEHDKDPMDIATEVRVYQNNDILGEVCDRDKLNDLVEKIKHCQDILSHNNFSGGES